MSAFNVTFYLLTLWRRQKVEKKILCRPVDKSDLNQTVTDFSEAPKTLNVNAAKPIPTLGSIYRRNEQSDQLNGKTS